MSRHWKKVHYSSLSLFIFFLGGCQLGGVAGSAHFDFAGQKKRVSYLTKDKFDNLTPTWSPDGSRIAFVSNRSGSYKLWLMNHDGTGLSPLTTGEGEERYPAWSPDGTKIAFSSTRSGNWDIWWLDVESAEAMQQLTTHRLSDLAPAWSRDSEKIAFVSYRDFEYSLYTMKADGSDQRKLTTGGNGDWGPTWSPDGMTLAFASTRTGDGDIYLIGANATPAGPYTRLTTAPQRDMIPVWSPNGSKIAFVSQRNGSRDIWAMNTDGTNQVQVTRKLSGRWEPIYDIDRDFIEGIGYFYLAWSPDGTSLAYTAVNAAGRGNIAELNLGEREQGVGVKGQGK